MRNRFPGVCYRCGTVVAVGEGHFERYKNAWRTQHATCCLIHKNGSGVGVEILGAYPIKGLAVAPELLGAVISKDGVNMLNEGDYAAYKNS